MKKPMKAMLSMIAISMIQNSLLAVANQQEGSLNIINQTSCSFTVHTEGFDGNSDYLNIKEGSDASSIIVEYNKAANGSRTAHIPVLIDCDVTSHVDTINLTLRNRGVTVSTSESRSFSQAKLTVSGDDRLDTDSSNITLLILPTELSGFTIE